MDFLVQGISLLSPRGVLHLSKVPRFDPTEKVNRLPKRQNPLLSVHQSGKKKKLLFSYRGTNFFFLPRGNGYHDNMVFIYWYS
jgi:hypothetical protein